MKIKDQYIWLENVDDSKVISWVDKENTRLRILLNKIPNYLEPKITKYYTTPYVYLVKISKKGYFLLIREKFSYKINLITRDREVSTLVDSSKLGKDVVLQWFYVNDEGDKLAYSYSYAGSDEGILKIIDTNSMDVLDEIKGVVSDVTWIDKDKYYYIRFYRRDKTPDGVNAPAERVFLRENYHNDHLVFGEGIQTSHFISLKKSLRNDKMLLTVSYGWTWSNVYGGDLNNPDSWELIYGKDEFITKPIDYIRGKYYIISYDDKDGLGRIIALDGDKRIIVRADKYPIRDAVILDNKIISHYIIDAASKIKVYNMNGDLIDELNISPPGTLSSFDRIDGEVIFKYESFYIPYRIYKLTAQNLELIDKVEIDNGFVVNDGWVKSYDDTPIHMFIFKRKDVDIKNVLVYGYGGFGIGLTPRFYPSIIPFVEDGGIFVVANIRGGDEFGEKWHRAGMRDKKINVFYDFMAVIKYFKDLNARVVAYGSSNGGLLVGATLVMKPTLIDAAVIGYPVLDMLRFHKLYIGKAWVPEYGNPDNPNDRKFLLKYSPYHNIRKAKYPPILVYTGLHDDRVHPGHAFKFVAKLKEIGAPIYLRTEKLSGHMGAAPKTKIKELTDVMAFIYKVMNIKIAN